MSGCVDERPVAEDPVAPPIEEARVPRIFSCPGEAGEPWECAGRLMGETPWQSEPFVAVDPEDDERVVVGIQTRGAADGQVHPMEFYSSKDSGVSWQRASSVPYGDGSDIAADPVAIFSANGRLHVSGLVSSPSTLVADATEIWTAYSDDLGATWSEVTLLSTDGDNDRQWMAADGSTIVAIWQKPTRGAAVPHVSAAWSHDAGLTWTGERIVADGCNLHTEPAVHADGFMFACSKSGEPCGALLHEMRWAEEEATPLRCLREQKCGTNIWTMDGPWWVLGCLSGWVTMSPDGGHTWTEPQRVTELVPAAADAGAFNIFWLEADGHGGAHFLLANFNAVGDPSGTVGSLKPLHVVLDARGLVIGVTTLAQGAGAAPNKGEFAGIGFGTESGVIAWIDQEHRARTSLLVAPE